MRKIFFAFITIMFLNSCEQILMEDDISDETVVLVAPANNSNFTSTGVTFTWDEIENGTQYRIQIARPDFENPQQIIVDNVTDTTSFTTQLNVGHYQWRVKGVNSGYETAYTTRSFTVLNNEDFQNNSVSLLTPSNNLVTKQPQQSLSWQQVLGATGYNFQVVDATGSTIIYNLELTANSVTYNFPEGSMKWRVRATNGSQYTLYAERTILTDYTAPGRPVLSLPANLSNTSNDDISFEWSRTAISGSTEKDSLYIFTDSSLNTLYYKNVQTSPYSTSTLPDGTYYWYVKAFDAAGNAGTASNTFSFTKN